MNKQFQQWCNENEGRAYPIAETATCVDDTGNSLPTDLLVDLHLMVDPQYRSAYVSSVWITPTLLGLSITHAGQPLASAMVNRTTYKPYTAVPLQPMPGVANLSGWVVFGNYRFTVRKRWIFSSAAQALIDNRAVKTVAPLPVTSMRKLGDDASVYADRIVKLFGGGYVRVIPHESDPQVIVVEVSPEGAQELFAGPCFKLAERGDCDTPILRQINGVCPNAQGIITLQFE
jgi:hypothetical protein